MKLTILGSGTSFGVPSIGCGCRVCTSADPRDRRTRVAALLEDDRDVRILVDTPPELRLQLVAAGVSRIDAVLYTHEHADHTHGIDDLRAITVRSGSIPVYGPRETLESLRLRFDYIFDARILARTGTSKPQLLPEAIEAGRELDISGVRVLPVELDHGGSRVFGYRFGDLAYLTDVKTMSRAAWAALEGVRVLVVSALFERSLPMHLSIGEAVELSRRLGVERTFITHLSHESTHADLSQRLPERVEPAHDGLVIAF